ncbi:tetraspanin-7-like isoform X1 [Abrus precatorius]|uniref:Tetraspanin-7-like isoform X1 n=1 Tax=Abrus precatorius TaxID=3816 RepID=A0A8B8JVF6_ABRPR|nr:tetraspanin-7-like isoform X1 [Abrus precatorius]
MVRVSNNLIGLLNFLTLLLSIPILITGVWLSKQVNTDCERWLERPFIVLGVFLLLVSLAGLVGACCRVSWLLWLYLFVMFLLIIVVFAFTIFTFVVTNKGAGEAISNRGYKEYRLGDYSNWLQKRVNNSHNWNRIRSCLQSGKLCSQFQAQFANDTDQQFYAENLSALQSGCCKPSNDCNFVYEGPSKWNKTEGVNYSNPDCNAWDNDPNVLCFNCQSCKAGLLQNLKTDWKKVAVVNIIFLVCLIIVYSIGCCAFRNNRRDNWKY